METYSFSLILQGREFNDDVVDDFYKAGGGDALLGISNGILKADYDRESESQAAAVLSAVKEVESIGFTVVTIETEAGLPKLYHWDNLTTCENYNPGHGIVMARNEAEARILLKEGLKAWLEKEKSWIFNLGDDDDTLEEMNNRIEKDAKSKISQIENENAAVIIRGSE